IASRTARGSYHKPALVGYCEEVGRLRILSRKNSQALRAQENRVLYPKGPQARRRQFPRRLPPGLPESRGHAPKEGAPRCLRRIQKVEDGQGPRRAGGDFERRTDHLASGGPRPGAREGEDDREGPQGEDRLRNRREG